MVIGSKASVSTSTSIVLGLTEPELKAENKQAVRQLAGKNGRC